jgi:co-chaperonin GroES (HSP10)
MSIKIKAMRDKILAEMIDNPGEETTTAGGIILISKDGTESAVRPRWFKVYSIGSEIDWLHEGQYVLVDHGRWSNGIKIDNELKIYLLDNKDCLMVSDENPMLDNNIMVGSKAIPQRPSDDMSRHAIG